MERCLLQIKTTKSYCYLVIWWLLILIIPAPTTSSVEQICCNGSRGNFDGDPLDLIDISDLVYMVAYQFLGGPPVPCFEEGDIFPNSTPDGFIDVADVVAMVSYQFGDGPAPDVCPFFIDIINLEYDDTIVYGIAEVPDTALYKIVIWAKTDRWYIQPSVAEPYTSISQFGVWSSPTNPWKRITALLVDSTYLPGSVMEEHPASSEGVLNWDEFPEKCPDKFLEWSGYTWRIKQTELAGPGPNYFSDDTTNVWIDETDKMHLKIDYRSDRWNCAEIVLSQSLGYGTYTFKVESRIDSLDYNTIFAGFIYDTTAEEFDFEFSQRLANPFNAQFVVQPWYISGNISFYDIPPITLTSHSFEWRADSIVFKSSAGHGDTATEATLISSWVYTGSDIPSPGSEKMRFNLYLFGGEQPVSGIGDEVTITSFGYSE